jgi:aryl-alcohol dehydrogenase-like predicted oxidoreductase
MAIKMSDRRQLWMHWLDASTSVEEVMTSLNHLVTAGKVLYLGVSDTPAWWVAKANTWAKANGMRPFSVYQGKWSASSRDFEREIIPMCKDQGMGLCPWGALGGGSFKSEEQRNSGEGRKTFKVAENDVKVSQVLERIAKKKNTLITSVALAYVMHKTPYVFPIVGGRKIEHLKGNIEALKLQLTEEDIDEIEGAVPFDLGFPQAFLGGPKGLSSPTNIWLLNTAAKFDYVEGEKPIPAGGYPSAAPFNPFG